MVISASWRSPTRPIACRSAAWTRWSTASPATSGSWGGRRSGMTHRDETLRQRVAVVPHSRTCTASTAWSWTCPRSDAAYDAPAGDRLNLPPGDRGKIR